jgi:hypothetical protein
MSNEEQEKLSLDYPISILIAERDNIHGLRKNQIEIINIAILILNEEKKMRGDMIYAVYKI